MSVSAATPGPQGTSQEPLELPQPENSFLDILKMPKPGTLHIGLAYGHQGRRCGFVEGQDRVPESRGESGYSMTCQITWLLELDWSHLLKTLPASEGYTLPLFPPWIKCFQYL